jgi:hypothetical protein
MKRPAVIFAPLIALTLILLFGGCASESARTEAEASKSEKPKMEPPAAGKRELAAPDLRIEKAAATTPIPVSGEGWKSMFDGKTLTGWRETDFAGHGPSFCEFGTMVLGEGAALTGVNWTNQAPKSGYEVALEALRAEGSDFFCGLTFPVGDSFCSLILGGWGGGVVGISSIDGQDASENETTQFLNFEIGRWYHVKISVTDAKIEAWLDEKKIVDVKTTGRKISMRYGEIELSKPLGLATYQTIGAFREIKMRRIDPAADSRK